MVTLVVYFSKFGNTKKVAEAIVQTLEQENHVQIVDSDELVPADFNDVDLVIMGSPTHNMNLPKAVRPVFERLPKKILKGKLVAAFDTSYKLSGWLYPFTAGKKLNKKLRKLGGKRIVPPEVFLVKEREGPLYEGEIRRAMKWAATILDRKEKIKTRKNISIKPGPILKGG
jgi:flavodoxin